MEQVNRAKAMIASQVQKPGFEKNDAEAGRAMAGFYYLFVRASLVFCTPLSIFSPTFSAGPLLQEVTTTPMRQEIKRAAIPNLVVFFMVVSKKREWSHKLNALEPGFYSKQRE